VCPSLGLETQPSVVSGGEPLPFEQNGCDIRVQRQFVLGALPFQLRDLAADISFPDLHRQAFEVDTSPRQAHHLADTKAGAAGQQDHTAIDGYDNRASVCQI
jgi:hypothetical protein